MPPGVRAYSMDLRERVVAAVDAGLTQSQAAARFGVSLRTVERYLARRRATGSPAATAPPPRRGARRRPAAARVAAWRRPVARDLARRRGTGSLAATEQRHGREPTVRRRLQAWLPARLGGGAGATVAEHGAGGGGGGGP